MHSFSPFFLFAMEVVSSSLSISLLTEIHEVICDFFLKTWSVIFLLPTEQTFELYSFFNNHVCPCFAGIELTGQVDIFRLFQIQLRFFSHSPVYLPAYLKLF